MSAGPIVAGVGLLLLLRAGAGAQLLHRRSCRASLVFGLGLAATVAPLTATVLGSVEPGHSGLASGVNNAVARVAGLLAIAALGAVVAGTFQSRLDSQLAHRPLSPQAGRPFQAAQQAARRQRQQRSTARAPVVHTALVDASVYAFRVGMAISGGLAILGGLIAVVGIENPRRRVPCADCPGGALVGITAEAARTPSPAVRARRRRRESASSTDAGLTAGVRGAVAA